MRLKTDLVLGREKGKRSGSSNEKQGGLLPHTFWFNGSKGISRGSLSLQSTLTFCPHSVGSRHTVSCSSHMWYWFTFPWCIRVEHIFICLSATCISFLEKCLFSSSAHFLNLAICFLWCWAGWAIYIMPVEICSVTHTHIYICIYIYIYIYIWY